MNIKRLLPFIVLLISSSVFAQNGTIIKANKYYESYSYQKAIDKFETVTEKSTDIYRKLADSYEKVGDLKKAEEYYSKLVKASDRTYEDLYNYASVLMMNEKYKEAKRWMKTYNFLYPDDSRGRAFVENMDSYEDLMNDKQQFSISNSSINSAQSDFGTAYYNDVLVFASSREGVKPVVRRWNWNGLAFLNLYKAEKSDSGDLSNPEQFYPKLNKKYHEGPACFTKDGSYMIYTKNNYRETDTTGAHGLEMYSMDYDGGKWINNKALPFNNDNYSVGHASLSTDGKTLYFSSDMPGGYGGVDIYMASRKADGSWSEAVNMGEKVNTEGDETFPFIHESERMLFFSSDGKPGLGGSDIFIAQLTEAGVGTVRNLGTPVNTNLDDFAFVLDSSESGGFFSSNRAGGKGNDDIYSFKLLKPFEFMKVIKGVAREKESLRILANTSVILREGETTIGSVLTDSAGNYAFVVEPNLEFVLEASKEAYVGQSRMVSSAVKEDVIIINLLLEPKPNIYLEGLVSDAKTGEILNNVSVLIINNDTKDTVLNVLTSEKGYFYKTLEGLKVNASLNYTIDLSKQGYLAKKENFKEVIAQEGAVRLHLRLDKIDIGLDIAKLIEIKPIYFDYNKSNIRPDAAIELDKIVKVMLENPNMEIELGSHTDARGTDSYNMKLSDRRAKASAAYIVSKGVSESRIKGKGYGETKLVNRCANGVKCSKKEHQENRRTEFIITKV